MLKSSGALTMSIRARVIVLLVAAVRGRGATVAAQQIDKGAVEWDFVVEDAEYLGNPARTYRAYSETEQLQLKVSVWNQSEEVITVEQAPLRMMLEVRVADANQETPVTIEWLEGVQLPGDAVPNIQIGPVYLKPHTGASWRVIVRLQNGERFLAGEYVITGWMHHLRRAVHTPDDSAWTGRMFDGPGKAKEGAGYLYMRLGQYREAIARFEEIMPRASGAGWNLVRMALARAYIAIRDEANALRVLRGSGLSEEAIASQLSELRRQTPR